MKKTILIALAVILFSPVALADNSFSYGQTEDGYYCHSESCRIVYSKDASLIGSYEHRESLGSSMWYTRHEISRAQENRRLTNEAYWNRIKAMRIIIGK